MKVGHVFQLDGRWWRVTRCELVTTYTKNGRGTPYQYTAVTVEPT